MSVTVLESKLQHAFQQGLNLSGSPEYSQLEFAKIPQWDSVAHLHLIAKIEDEFGIMMETSDVLALSSYTKAIEIVKKYAPARS